MKIFDTKEIFGVYMHASSSPMEDLVKDVRNRNKNISNDEKNGEKKTEKRTNKKTMSVMCV